MKLEPVARMYQHDETGRTMALGASANFIEWEKANPRWLFVSGLYAIPEGYKLVPVEQAKDAERFQKLADHSFACFAFPDKRRGYEYHIPAGMTLCHGSDLRDFVDKAVIEREQ